MQVVEEKINSWKYITQVIVCEQSSASSIISLLSHKYYFIEINAKSLEDCFPAMCAI